MACGLVAVIVAGCGSAGGGTVTSSHARGSGGMMGGSGGMMGGGGTRHGSTTTPTTTASGGGKSASSGRALFVGSGCGGCHTLAAAGTTGTAGPSLDEARPTYARVLERVTDGAGAMPGFADSLTPAQIRAIARYVSGATRG
jgi:cytochrome c553